MGPGWLTQQRSHGKEGSAPLCLSSSQGLELGCWRWLCQHHARSGTSTTIAPQDNMQGAGCSIAHYNCRQPALPGGGGGDLLPTHTMGGVGRWWAFAGNGRCMLWGNGGRWQVMVGTCRSTMEGDGGHMSQGDGGCCQVVLDAHCGARVGDVSCTSQGDGRRWRAMVGIAGTCCEAMVGDGR